MFNIENAEATEVHNQRTTGLTEDQKKIFNDGYLWASSDALGMIQEVLDEDLSSGEKIEILNLLMNQATIPLLLASLSTGKGYLG